MVQAHLLQEHHVGADLAHRIAQLGQDELAVEEAEALVDVDRHDGQHQRGGGGSHVRRPVALCAALVVGTALSCRCRTEGPAPAGIVRAAQRRVGEAAVDLPALHGAAEDQVVAGAAIKLVQLAAAVDFIVTAIAEKLVDAGLAGASGFILKQIRSVSAYKDVSLLLSHDTEIRDAIDKLLLRAGLEPEARTVLMSLTGGGGLFFRQPDGGDGRRGEDRRRHVLVAGRRGRVPDAATASPSRSSVRYRLTICPRRG